MNAVSSILFCFRCGTRRGFNTIDREGLIWVCGSCGAVRDLTDEDLHEH